MARASIGIFRGTVLHLLCRDLQCAAPAVRVVTRPLRELDSFHDPSWDRGRLSDARGRPMARNKPLQRQEPTWLAPLHSLFQQPLQEYLRP
jgi:hypothetical protein